MDIVEVDDRLDKAFKPGLFEQTRAFVDRDDRQFCTVHEQLQHSVIYAAMAGYGS